MIFWEGIWHSTSSTTKNDSCPSEGEERRLINPGHFDWFEEQTVSCNRRLTKKIYFTIFLLKNQEYPAGYCKKIAIIYSQQTNNYVHTWRHQIKY